MRIGEVAAAVGTTSRTVRYYEEIGLLRVSLDELRELLEAQDARAALRDEWQHGDPGPARRAQILRESSRHLDRQLELVGRRREEIEALENELLERRARVRELLSDVDARDSRRPRRAAAAARP
jgi:DNA-binding transcriptional MerR regulator